MAEAKLSVLFMQSQEFFGADSMVHSLLMRHLDRDRFDVHVACAAGPDGAGPSMEVLGRIPGIAVVPMNFGPSVNSRRPSEVAAQLVGAGIPALTDMRGLVRYARRHGIDVVHATEKPRDAFYGYLLSRLVGAGCVIHLHVKAESWISPLSRWAMGQSDALVGVSDFVKGSLVDMGYPTERIHTVLNALDEQQWEPVAPDTALRGEFGIADDVPIVLTASRLFPWKGQTELLRALDVVRRGGRRFHLFVVGESDPRATPGGGNYLTDLQAWAERLDLADVVTFTGYRADVRRFMATCDIFAMPSYEEPFGIVYLEAMALQKPVVALDNGGTREVVTAGTTGLLSPPYDIPALAANLEQLLDDPGLRARMGSAGRQRLIDHFTPRRLAADTAQVYEQVVAARASRRVRRPGSMTARSQARARSQPP